MLLQFLKKVQRTLTKIRPCQIDFLYRITRAPAEKLGTLNHFIKNLPCRFFLIIIGEKRTKGLSYYLIVIIISVIIFFLKKQ